jgi:predicted alpha-1,2-mannosidase
MLDTITPTSNAEEPVASVNPMIGTATVGHTFPGAVVPFGMVQLSPDTGTDGWEHCSGYHYEDNTILGFSHTHLSGTGCSDLGDILFQPTVGPVRMDEGDASKPASGYRSSFSHADETASPGYYRVLLKDYGINVELTATAHAGLHQYTFPASDQAHVIIDLAHGIGSHSEDSALLFEDAQTISGYRRSSGWANNKTFYFVASFSRPFASHDFVSDGLDYPEARFAKGKDVRGHVDFTTKTGDKILVRIGLSPVSVEEARKNLQAEIPNWNFDATAAAARAAWNRELGTVEITTKDDAVRTTFYTALYHAMISPNLYNDVDRTYTGADGKWHAAEFDYYCTFSVWDQFRAWHPLMSIIQPKRVNDFVNSMLAFYEQENQHALPVWTLCSNETGCMIGVNSLPIIADAYAKGFRGYDVNKAYAAMVDSASQAQNYLDDFNQHGYVATRGPDEHDDYKQSVSRTLEYAYDDWCLAQMANALGKTDDAKLYLSRAANYRNVFDPQTRFMRGKTKDGAFVTPFDPKTFYKADFTEADSWQYSFFVPQDPDGLVQLMGGDEAFIAKLDRMFSEDSVVHEAVADISGMIGQYAQGNEPVHHVAYLYSYAGAPYKTQARIREIMTKLYTDKPDGLCGNDDCGQMSAWYVLGALGFYPANPADGNYVIGSPLIDKAVIHLDPKYYPGGTFTVTARDNSPANIYIQSVTLNGRPLEHSYFTHGELAAGGKLVLQMGSKPNMEWGKAASDRPPSMDSTKP